MDELTALGVAWDAWRATRGGTEGVLTRQRERLSRMVAHARTRSRFYAELYRDLPDGPPELEYLPVVTKPRLMAAFEDWVVDPEIRLEELEAFVADPSRIGLDYRGRYAVFTTSGSSGVPAILVQDRTALAVMTGLSYARGVGLITPRELWQALRRGGRQAAIFATGGHFLGAAMLERRRRARPWRARISRLFSALAPLPELVRELNAFQPALLGGYPSALALLAREQEAGRLRIHPVIASSGGETLTPAARARISAAFHCRVFESYSASEATPLSIECQRGRLHVNADWFILEAVDQAYRPVPPGELSHTSLVTNLANRVQPILRYELGDRVAVSKERCPCGSPLPVVRVEGRTNDVIAIPRQGGGEVHLLPLALETVLEETPGLYRFQLIQTGPTTLALRLETRPGADRERVWSAARARLAGYLAGQGLSTVDIQLRPEPPLPDARSGKLRHVWAEWRPRSRVGR